MGEFDTAVSALIEAFGNGIAIIKSLRKQRKEKRVIIDSAAKADESQLSKTLKKSSVRVQDVYRTNLERLGRRFAAGDAKARSSLTSILFRLNAGFVSIIDKFTRGESTRTDYQTLVNLSNASRIEAIKTLEQLSTRVSKSSVGLSTTRPKRRTRRIPEGQNVASSHSSRTNHHSRAGPVRPRSAPGSTLKQTALGPATSRGWVRPKMQKSGGERTMDPSLSRKKAESHSIQNLTVSKSRMPTVTPKTHPQLVSSPENRMSILSFTSDSTKLGEIPERRRPTVNTDGQDYMTSTAFPLAPWKRPEKPRSKFMRLFRK